MNVQLKCGEGIVVVGIDGLKSDGKQTYIHIFSVKSISWIFFRDCQAGGDRPDLELNLDKVFSPDNTSIAGEAYKKDDGYTHFKELGPDFFRTPEDTPQVQIMVNDYPAW